MSRRSPAFTAPLGEPQLARAVRRAQGAYYTPPQIVRLILDLTLTPALSDSPRDPPRVIDPACGGGEFLAEAALRLRAKYGSRARVFGIELDGSAANRARKRLGSAGIIRHANALLGDRNENGAFDVVVGNPPYLSIRQLAKSVPADEIAGLRREFRTARGNFDLYVLFLERALAMLKPGGRCGLIVPNKWATLDYARPCRELLLEQATLEHVLDLSNERVFAAASVYPHVLVFRKQPPAAQHLVRYRSFNPQPEATARSANAVASGSGLNDVGLPQCSLSPTAFVFSEPLDVESRVATRPLGELAVLSCGTAGYAAQRIAGCLRNATEGVPYSAGEADFITSGNIDRYAIRLGNVRFLGRTYERPRLSLAAAELSPARRRLFASPKIVIAGMSRRLEAAWDVRGLALGVQVFAASQCQVEPFYLLALLNSKLLSYLFATRFAAKRLAGGYLAINKGQLARLPIVVCTGAPAERVGVLLLEERLSHLGRLLSGRAGGQPHEAEADRLVYRLYQLTAAEVARVESHFAAPAARAA